MGDVIPFPCRPFPGQQALSRVGGSAQPLAVLDMLRRLVQARRFARLAATLDNEAARSVLLERARQLVSEAGTMGRLIKAGRGG